MTSDSTPSTERLKDLKAVVFDCDGVLTPGDLFYGPQGQRMLRFHARDGFGLAVLCRQGIAAGILSGRPTDIAEQRFRELGVSHFHGRCHDKYQGLLDMCTAMEISPTQCAFVGDDLPDLPAFTAAGMSIAVADATPEIQEAADWVLKTAGGFGAAREVAEGILKAHGHWQHWIQQHTGKQR